MKNPGLALMWLVLAVATPTVRGADSPRRTLSLDGLWQIAEGKLDAVPDEFLRTVSSTSRRCLTSPTNRSWVRAELRNTGTDTSADLTFEVRETQPVRSLRLVEVAPDHPGTE